MTASSNFGSALSKFISNNNIDSKTFDIDIGKIECVVVDSRSTLVCSINLNVNVDSGQIMKVIDCLMSIIHLSDIKCIKIKKLSTYSNNILLHSTVKHIERYGSCFNITYNDSILLTKSDRVIPKIRCNTLYDAVKYTFDKPSGLYHIYTDEGILRGGLGAFGSSRSTYIIHYIALKYHLRGKHLWSGLLRKLAENPTNIEYFCPKLGRMRHSGRSIDTISVCAVTSIKMDQIMTKLRIQNVGFINQGGDFTWKRPGCND